MKYPDAALLLGRVMASAMFVTSGLLKLTTPEATKAYFLQVGVPLVEIAYPIAVATELVGSFCLILGFRPRLGAFLLAAYCVATAFMVHTDFSNRAASINFNKNIAMAGGYLAFIAVGAGAYSLDRLLARRKTA